MRAHETPFLDDRDRQWYGGIRTPPANGREL